MKNFIFITIALIVAFGLLVLCGWAVSALLNIGLSQMGLGTINIWAGCGIVVSAHFIKWYICWGSK